MTKIRNATKLPKLYKEWVLLKENGYRDYEKKYPYKDYCAVKVFDGDIYSLINDHDFYEYGGCRRSIISLLYYWDPIYDLLINTDIEYAGKKRIIVLSGEQEQKWDRYSKYFEEQLEELMVKVEDLSKTST
jgi:hypothetical protein